MPFFLRHSPWVLVALALVFLPLTPALAQTYAHSPMMRRLLHWKHLPVPVFIATHSPAQQTEARIARAGFDEWSQAAGVALFKMVDHAPQAGIVVRFTNAPDLAGLPGVVGQTNIAARGRELRKADIWIATGNLDPGALQSVAAHEFGHALGIDGHSDNPADLMYPSETQYLSPDGDNTPTPVRRVTQRDLNTLRLCYPSLPARTLTTPAE